MSRPETKICQNCKKEFIIEPEDFDFYEKIKVPPPTWCPECRNVRRMTWRNERSLYKRRCELTGKDVITCFSPTSRIKVLDRDVWWSDKWNSFAYGREYDFNKPFFQQFRELLEFVPMPSLFNSRCINSPYGNHNGELKNAYLVFATWGGEEIMYAKHAHGCKDSLDILASQDSELVYEVVNSTKISRSAFVENSENCLDCYFIYGCRSCNNCFGCTNLRNKSYHIFNQPYKKEDYFKKVQEFDLGSFRNLIVTKKDFADFELKAIHRFARIYNSQNSTGDNLSNVSDCKTCFDVSNDVRDCKYCINAANHTNDCYDSFGIGVNSELLYETIDTGANGSRLYFNIFVWGGLDVRYCYGCHGSQNMFGCIALHNKQYCILNKQYTKQEYESLVPRIIAHMQDMPYIAKRQKSKGKSQNYNSKVKSEETHETEEIVYRYGEFFPPELSPFCYNETIAQEYFPLTKEQALAQGYRWKDPEPRNYQITMRIQDIPDNIKDVPDSIINEIIECASATEIGTGPFFANEKNGPVPISTTCTTAFKIIKPELEFYRRMNLPLPRYCPNCRHYQRLQQRNPLKLWKRQCQCGGRTSANGLYHNTITHQHGTNPCPEQFKTSYAPHRPEIVYCEKCYLAEVV